FACLDIRYWPCNPQLGTDTNNKHSSARRSIYHKFCGCLPYVGNTPCRKYINKPRRIRHIYHIEELTIMRTVIILVSGLILFAAVAMFSKLFSDYYSSATTWGVSIFLTLWLFATGFNMWVGVNKAGYSYSEEFPIMLLLFLVPAVVAI